MQMKPLTPSQILDHISAQSKKQTYHYQSQYYAMYSSWYGGITTDPSLMLIPVDDHIVHRGDGVFEAIKIVQGRIYLLEEHIERLIKSANRLFFPTETQSAEFKTHLRNIIIQTSKVAAGCAQVKVENFNAILRLYLSRGPGSFGTNPADSVGSQVYCVVTKLTPPSPEKYEKGVTVGRSQIAVKTGGLAQVKSCNYLQNVLMKKESVDRGLDFTIGFTEEGLIAEGSTENIIIIDRLGRLLHPKLDYILKGTTMNRLFDLVESAGVLPIIRGAEIMEEDLLLSQGAFMIGTTLDLLPVCSYEGKKLPISPLASKFLQMIREDQRKGFAL